MGLEGKALVCLLFQLYGTQGKEEKHDRDVVLAALPRLPSSLSSHLLHGVPTVPITMAPTCMLHLVLPLDLYLCRTLGLDVPT